MESKAKGQIKNMIIGAFVVGGLAIFTWSLFFFKPQVGDGENRLIVRFASIANISVGTRVTYAGKPVGEVIAIHQVLDARNEKGDLMGRPYTYELVLAIDSSVKVYSNDLIEIQTTGLMGEKVIAIIPQVSKPGAPKPHLVNNGIIYADSVDTLTQTLLDISGAAVEAKKTISQVSDLIEKNQQNITDSIQTLNESLQEIHKTTQEINTLDIVGSVHQATLSFTQTLNNANHFIDEVRATNVVARIESISKNVDEITQDIAQGKGTIGKLVTDPTLYYLMVSFMTRADILMYDLNHYGLFYNRNSEWKKNRINRVDKMNALASPQQFQSYYEKETTEIGASLARIQAVVQKAQAEKRPMNSQQLRDAFYQLLIEVQALKELIQNYNQELQEQAEPKAANG